MPARPDQYGKFPGMDYHCPMCARKGVTCQWCIDEAEARDAMEDEE